MGYDMDMKQLIYHNMAHETTKPYLMVYLSWWCLSNEQLLFVAVEGVGDYENISYDELVKQATVASQWPHANYGRSSLHCYTL